LEFSQFLQIPCHIAVNASFVDGQELETLRVGDEDTSGAEGLVNFGVFGIGAAAFVIEIHSTTDPLGLCGVELHRATDLLGLWVLEGTGERKDVVPDRTGSIETPVTIGDGVG